MIQNGMSGAQNRTLLGLPAGLADLRAASLWALPGDLFCWAHEASVLTDQFRMPHEMQAAGMFSHPCRALHESQGALLTGTLQIKIGGCRPTARRVMHKMMGQHLLSLEYAIAEGLTAQAA